MPDMDIQDLLDQLAERGGVIVCSNECSHSEIAQARACGRFYVDKYSRGFVLRPDYEGNPHRRSDDLKSTGI